MSELDMNSWYGCIPDHDRKAVDAIANWLRPVPWQLFVTLTFPWNVRAETADRKFHQLIDGLERQLRSNVCFVAGKEMKPASFGMNVPWHFHALLVSHAKIPAAAVEYNWDQLVSPGRARPYDNQTVQQETGDVSALVEPYDSHRRGPEYCLKTMNGCFGDWHMRRLEHFLPGARGSARPNHRSVRAAKRNRERLLGSSSSALGAPTC